MPIDPTAINEVAARYDIDPDRVAQLHPTARELVAGRVDDLVWITKWRGDLDRMEREALESIRRITSDPLSAQRPIETP